MITNLPSLTTTERPLFFILLKKIPAYSPNLFFLFLGLPLLATAQETLVFKPTNTHELIADNGHSNTTANTLNKALE